MNVDHLEFRIKSYDATLVCLVMFLSQVVN